MLRLVHAQGGFVCSRRRRLAVLLQVAPRGLERAALLFRSRPGLVHAPFGVRDAPLGGLLRLRGALQRTLQLTAQALELSLRLGFGGVHLADALIRLLHAVRSLHGGALDAVRDRL